EETEETEETGCYIPPTLRERRLGARPFLLILTSPAMRRLTLYRTDSHIRTHKKSRDVILALTIPDGKSAKQMVI
nr:hypothetical protein [Tanacetum cinerariifolium]